MTLAIQIAIVCVGWILLVEFVFRHFGSSWLAIAQDARLHFRREEQPIERDFIVTREIDESALSPGHAFDTSFSDEHGTHWPRPKKGEGDDNES